MAEQHKRFKNSTEANQVQEAMFDSDVDFNNVGSGFTVEIRSTDNAYGIECSGYSNNTSKKI